ncbi:FAD-dependent monooxygenase [Sorangium atrum]|uniref:FAD-dependent monooxygenase n=1 Tax=Sorangium atrum TaxID=2995308 RepID=A0ABT5BZA0_9BACT|nr:FAD-dependent monooxygenase [Sorangium aterium]MDC0679487.1 FAD-dependent monooxygenase [Sorangium aterium]
MASVRCAIWAFDDPRELLGAMADAPDFYFDRMIQIDMDRWSAGRVVLLGDAGYCPSPASGQGTSLALVGAYVLAGELAASGGDHGVAFARYEARRCAATWSGTRSSAAAPPST